MSKNHYPIKKYKVSQNNESFYVQKFCQAIMSNDYSSAREAVLTYPKLHNIISYIGGENGTYKTLFQIAYKNGNYELINFLVNKKFHINNKDSFGKTLIHDIFSNPYLNSSITIKKDLELLGSFLNHGFDIKEVEKIAIHNNNFFNALQTYSVSENNLYILHLLASLKKNVDENISFAKYFIENGGDIEQQDPGKHTPLVYAVIKNNLSFFDFLITKGANINSINYNCNSLLHHVSKIKKKGTKYIEPLIKAGADINLLNSCGKSPLDIAFDEGNLASLRILIDHGAEISDSITENIYYEEAADDNHKFCQDLLYIAKTAWSFIEPTQKSFTVNKAVIERYTKLIEKNQELITTIGNNIILASSTKEILLKRFSTWQEKWQKLGLNPGIVVPPEELLNLLASIAKQEIVKSHHKEELHDIFKDAPFGFIENDVTNKFLNEVFNKPESREELISKKGTKRKYQEDEKVNSLSISEENLNINGECEDFDKEYFDDF